MSTHLEPPVAENSDFDFRALLVGEDGATPIDPDVVEEILMVIRDVTGGVLITATPRDVTAQLGSLISDPAGDYNFSVALTAVDNRVIEGSGENQIRLITLMVTHSAGRKRNQEFTYNLDAMQDVPDTIVP